MFVRHSHPPPLSRWEGQSWLLHCRPQCSQFIGCFTLLNQTKLSCSPITIAGHRSSLSFVFELSKAVSCWTQKKKERKSWGGVSLLTHSSLKVPQRTPKQLCLYLTDWPKRYFNNTFACCATCERLSRSLSRVLIH